MQSFSLALYSLIRPGQTHQKVYILTLNLHTAPTVKSGCLGVFYVKHSTLGLAVIGLMKSSGL